MGNHNKTFLSRRCLNSYTNKNTLINPKEKSGEDNICAIRTSSESHLYRKKQFHKNPLYFRFMPDSEADNEIDGSNIGKKTTNIYKQNPVLDGYYLISDLEDILKSGYYHSPLGYDNVDWYVNKLRNLANKVAFFFKNTKKDIVMTEDEEEEYRNYIICRFCEKKYLLIKLEIIVT